MRETEESIARAGSVILLANLLSRLLGFLREVLIAYFFGAQAVTDSFLVASILPAAIAGLISGALTTVFIPVFVEEREIHGEERAWEGTRVVFGTSLLYLLVMLGAGYVVAPWFIRAVAPGFEEERLRLALSMNRVMLPSLVFLGLFGLSTGIFQSYRLFTLPALAGLLYNVSLIAFLVGGRRSPVLGLALGSLAGTIIQVVPLLLFARRRWRGWGMSFSLRHPMLQRIWGLMLPIFIGTGVGYLNLLVDRAFASLLPEGTIAALNFAVRVKEIPTGLFVVALSQAIYPVASRQAVQGRVDELRELFVKSLGTLWLFIVPSGAGLVVLARETIAFLFERGAFTPQATTITAEALAFYSLGLLATASLDVTGRIFYSLQDTKTPVKVSILGLLLNILLNALLVHRMAHRGLALATSLSATFMFVVLFAILRQRLHGVGGRRLGRDFGKILCATLVMVVVVGLLRPFIQNSWTYLGVVAAGGVTYGVGALILKLEGAKYVLEALKKGWGKVRKGCAD
nr:murein biosynthesis integral membrane protein MurJ [Candidatus Calescibacterium sp.]